MSFPISINHFFFIFLLGGMGATLRTGLSLIFQSLTTKVWSGTLFVNLLGTLIFFLISRYKFNLTSEQSWMIKAGLLGSLTTFSTFCFEIVSLFRNGSYLEAAGVIFLNVVFGIIIGIWIIR